MVNSFIITILVWYYWTICVFMEVVVSCFLIGIFLKDISLSYFRREKTIVNKKYVFIQTYM